MGGRHDDVAKSLSHAQGALSPGDNRRDGTRMVPSAVIAYAGSERGDPDAARPRALEIGERRKLGHSLREKRYDRAYVLPNSFKSALVPFFAGIPHRTGWRGEMRYGLLNDARVLDKEARPLMVERYVALAYDKGVMRSAKDLPQPLLWPQLRKRWGEIPHLQRIWHFVRTPDDWVLPGAEFGPAKRWPHYHYAELAKQLIDEGYQIVLFGSAKDHEAGNEILATLSTEQQAGAETGRETQLEQAVILIAACKAVVTNDSGLMHVAAALDRPRLRCMAQAARTSRRRCRTRRA